MRTRCNNKFVVRARGCLLGVFELIGPAIRESIAALGPRGRVRGWIELQSPVNGRSRRDREKCSPGLFANHLHLLVSTTTAPGTSSPDSEIYDFQQVAFNESCLEPARSINFYSFSRSLSFVLVEREKKKKKKRKRNYKLRAIAFPSIVTSMPVLRSTRKICSDWLLLLLLLLLIENRNSNFRKERRLLFILRVTRYVSSFGRSTSEIILICPFPHWRELTISRRAFDFLYLSLLLARVVAMARRQKWVKRCRRASCVF